MSSIYITSDHHFFHRNIIKYCNRPFDGLKEMHDAMIENWNKTIGKNDIVYHLGDFCLGSKQRMESILVKLRGQIYLCIGSHDKTAAKYFQYFAMVKESFFLNVGPGIFMAHHCHKIWPKSHYDSYHCFGHSHGGMDLYAENEGKLLDVGVDSHDFTPWHIDEVISVMKKRPLNFNSLRRNDESRHSN